MSYYIIRFYSKVDPVNPSGHLLTKRRTIERGLTLEEAQAHCKDPPRPPREAPLAGATVGISSTATKNDEATTMSNDYSDGMHLLNPDGSYKVDEIGFTTGPSHIRFETVNRRYRRAGIALQLALLIGCTLIDLRLGVGALLMGAATLIEHAVQKEPWKPKPPRYIFDRKN